MRNVSNHHPTRTLLEERPHFSFRQMFTFFIKLAKHHRQRHEVDRLRVLPDYLLNDIGLTRDDLERQLSATAFPADRATTACVLKDQVR